MSNAFREHERMLAAKSHMDIDNNLSSVMERLTGSPKKTERVPDRYFFDRIGKIYTVKPDGSCNHPNTITIKEYSENGNYMPRVEILYENEDMSSAPKEDYFIETHPLRESVEQTRLWASKLTGLGRVAAGKNGSFNVQKLSGAIQGISRQHFTVTQRADG
jgi:CRISPR/Cas system CSM-associated protein Csm3 (group 7 of RAMP superfamily)